MSNRGSWKFAYDGASLLAGVRGRLEYHRGRLAYYQEERDKAEAELRAAGVEFREHDVTGGKQVTAVLDPEKQQWLNKCASKITTHTSSIEDFERWERAVEHNVTERFELDTDDVRYFGL